MGITLAEAVDLPARLRGACRHVLDAIDERQRYFEAMSRPGDRPPSPMRLALDAEYARRG